MFKGLLPIKSAEKYVFIEFLESNVPAPAWIWIYPSQGQNLKGFKEPQVSRIHDFQSI